VWSRKGRRSRPPSLRGSRVPVGLPARRSMLLQKSVGDVWSRISSANALQKERSGSSERGPSSERRSAGDTVGRRVERRVRRESASPVTRERTGARPRVTRECHPAVTTSPKAVAWSWDQGCNGHWILRRALADGRHSGSSRGVSFHEGALTVVSAVSRILRPVHASPKLAPRSPCSFRESRRGVRMNEGWRQGCQRLDRVNTVGPKRPRS
jgi:hypothetical protein